MLSMFKLCMHTLLVNSHISIYAGCHLYNVVSRNKLAPSFVIVSVHALADLCLDYVILVGRSFNFTSNSFIHN